MLSIDRSADTLLRRRNKRRLIIDIDSTEDPVHGKQEGAAFNGYFEQVCYHPLFCFTGNGDLLGAKLRPGNAHSADGVLSLISPWLTATGLGSSNFGFIWQSKSFFGWNPTQKCSPAPIGGRVDAVFRKKC